MTEQDFRIKIEGGLNDHLNAQISRKEYLDLVCDTILELSKSKWIDVKKEYPPLDTMVLTTQHGRMDVNEPRYYMVLKFNNHGNWVTEFGESDDTYFEPTHWQPLPQSPEERV